MRVSVIKILVLGYMGDATVNDNGMRLLNKFTLKENAEPLKDLHISVPAEEEKTSRFFKSHRPPVNDNSNTMT